MRLLINLQPPPRSHQIEIGTRIDSDIIHTLRSATVHIPLAPVTVAIRTLYMIELHLVAGWTQDRMAARASLYIAWSF